MFHILYSQDPVFKQAATLILLSSNVVSFSELSNTVPMFSKRNIVHTYIYVYIHKKYPRLSLIQTLP